MSLGCNIQEVKQNAFEQIKKVVEGKSSTIKMNNQGIITFNYNNSSKYNTPVAAYNVAQSKIKAVEKWASENVGPKFSKGWVALQKNANETWLQYQFPQYVLNAYAKKFAVLKQRAEMQKQIEEARQQHIEDAKRAGVDESEFNDGYMYFQYEDDYDELADPEFDNLGEPEFDSQEVVSNDFTSYYQHKVELLKKLEDKYETYKTLNKSNYGTDKYKKDSYTFQNVINKLKDEIENLDINNVNNVFQDVINELDYLNNILDNIDTDVFKNQDIINRIDFLNQMITGQNLNGEQVNDNVWDGSNFPEYDSTIGFKMSKLTTKLKQKEQQIIKELLDKDIVYQAHKDEFSEEEIQSLFEKMSDIGFLQEYFLGINSNNDSIVATLLNTTFQTNVQKTKQFARPFVEAIKELDKKLKDKNFSLNNFFEKEDGIDTGNIIHKYTKKYFRKVSEYFNINKQFNQANKQNKPDLYHKKVSWLKENSEVIDFRKIKYFKDVYGEQYSDFFTSSDEEMENYENELKQSLGKLYNSHISDLEKKLSEYENYKMNEESKNTKWLSKNIHTNSPWIFIQNYYSDNAFNQVEYQSGNNTYFTFNNSKFIEFVPKKSNYNVDTMQNEDTGFYNKDFEQIENDNDAFSYWESIREMYSKHINPTYASTGQNISSLSWAKFERDFSEEMKQSEGIKGFFQNLWNEALKAFRQLWYEKGYYTDKEGIRSNYTDATLKEIGKIKKAVSLKSLSDIQKMADEEGITYTNLSEVTKGLTGNDLQKVTDKYKEDLIDKIARKKVLTNYSKDLTKTTLALSELASLHKARQETQFIADMLINYHKTIKDKNNKDRNKSNAKLQSWIDTNIYNKRAVSRGNAEDELGAENNSRFWKYYSDTEKELLKILNGLKDTSADNTVNYSFFTDGVNYSKKGSSYYETIDGKPNKISKETFESALQQHINSEIEKLGIGITPGGIGLGIMKVIINKALALNPVSGIFNRTDGMFANMIRDNMGDYWTRGNLKYAKRFLSLANINKFAGEKLSLQSKQKLLQMNTYQKLLDELALFQDKKNELDRKDKESRFNEWKEKLNIFQFAVDNPEFKNQSEIVLSMLMDTIIKDNNGNEYKFFDGSGFPAYKPGTLELRDEFKNDENLGWENFALNDNNPSFNKFFVQKLKIEDTIKKTQGNYASLDSIKVLDNNWGKFLMLFMRWMPEHVNQRFGSRSIDIIQGKKKIAGRYNGLLRNAGATGVFGSLALGIAFGPAGLIAGSSAAILPFVLKRFYGKYVYGEDDVKNTLMDLQTTIGFMKEILIQTANIPLKVTYSKLRLDDKISNKQLNDTTKLSQDEINALKGMAQESAIMISQLMVLLLLKSLLYNPDDDDEDFRRQLHNFVDNQANRSINSMLSFSNPRALIEDNSKLAMLRYIGDLEKFVDFTWEHFTEDKGTNMELASKFLKVQPAVPIPNMVVKSLNGEYPGIDKKEYQNAQWFDKMIKGSEWRDEQKIKNKRKKVKEVYEEMLRQKYEAKNIPDDKIDDMVEKQSRKRMNKSDVKKKKTETDTQALERIDFDAVIEEIKKEEGK